METAGLVTDDLLTPGEVARLFRVRAKTVARWADEGKIAVVRTAGGHRRFRVAEVEGLMRSCNCLGEDEHLTLSR
ncbi:MAG: BldC family transcriptional regulator [Bowdeniella nasicola]|nr:BldC family transcriptional regulator [Bowdeniella nasicola]